MDSRWIYKFKERLQIQQIVLGVIAISITGGYLNSVVPSGIIEIVIGVGLIGASIYFLSSLFLNNVRRQLLVSIGFALILFLRAMKLYDPLYTILLGAILISLEYALNKL